MEQFSMSIYKNLFSDPDDDTLKLSLRLNGAATNELPDWFQFDDVYWSIKFTPPAHLLRSYINITAIVSDQFQQIQDHIRIRVDISWMYVIKIIA